MSVNKVILLGRVGKDPETRNLDNGNTVSNFTIATSESYKDKSSGERKETTTWHNIVMWGKTAEIAQKYVHKGDQVYIEGKIQTRTWEKEGTTRYITEVVGNNLTLLGSKSDNGATVSDNGSDDLPF